MKVEIRNLFFIIAIQFLGFQSIAQTITTTEEFSIGERVTFDSEVLNEERILNIYLPNGYTEASDKVYPVIYLLDGSKDEDFIHIAGLVQFGSFSWINMIPETIVVGIENVDRKRDFTYPSTDKVYKEKYPTTGASAKFIDFMEEELQPLIEKTYRVSEEKTLIGQSLGGLVATEILFKKPDLFTNYIIVSPSLWYDYESLLKMTPETYDSKKSIYIAVGEEGKIMKRVAEELHKKLKDLKKRNTKLYYKFLEEQDHGDALHLAAYGAFENLFSENKK